MDLVPLAVVACQMADICLFYLAPQWVARLCVTPVSVGGVDDWEGPFGVSVPMRLKAKRLARPGKGTGEWLIRLPVGRYPVVPGLVKAMVDDTGRVVAGRFAPSFAFTWLGLVLYGIAELTARSRVTTKTEVSVAVVMSVGIYGAVAAYGAYMAGPVVRGLELGLGDEAPAE